MAPVDAFMDLLYLIPFTVVPGLIYLFVSAWWSERQGRVTQRRASEPRAGSSVDTPALPAAAAIAAAREGGGGGDEFDL